MQILLKYKIFRIANYGVMNTVNFKEKKTLQIYNVFLLLVCANVFLMSILLIIFGFYRQLIPAFLSLLSLSFSLYLNKKGHTLISKIFIIQFHIVCVLSILIIFSFTSIFSLYFFLIILYCSLIFFESEKRIMLFFIIQCLFLLFISLTPIHKIFPDFYLLKGSDVSRMNLICIVGYLFFLFIFIYFHTEHQRKLEVKYLAMNKRLITRNEINKKNNNNSKKLLKIISTLLQLKLNHYKKLLDEYLTTVSETSKNQEDAEKLYLKMSMKNKEIEELINFRFTNNREALLIENYETCNIIEKSVSIINKMMVNNVKINKSDDFILTIHASLYENFLMEFIKNKLSSYNPKEILININCTDQVIDCVTKKNCFNIFGITVLYKQNLAKDVVYIQLLFQNNPDNKAIYYV